jgi:AAA ATPase domain
VLRVVGPSAVASRFEALRGSALTRLVGRDEEIDLLLRRGTRTKAGEGQVVLISGEPGIGKSRITAAFEERLTPSYISVCAISARPITGTARCSHSSTSSAGRRGSRARIWPRGSWRSLRPCSPALSHRTRI